MKKEGWKEVGESWPPFPWDTPRGETLEVTRREPQTVLLIEMEKVRFGLIRERATCSRGETASHAFQFDVDFIAGDVLV